MDEWNGLYLGIEAFSGPTVKEDLENLDSPTGFHARDDQLVGISASGAALPSD
jgi:hypothetical protein